MSAILDTLKKLEEEKSLMGHGVDLKDRLVRDEPSDEASPAKRSAPLLVIAILILAAIAAGFGIGELLNRGKETKAPVVVNKPQAVAPGAVRVQPPADHLGVPLSTIPEAEDTVGLMEEDLYNARRTQRALQAGATSDGLGENVAPEAGMFVEEEAAMETGADADFLSGGNLEQVSRTEPVAVSPEPQLEARAIPGLKITGIIYFSKSNPSNYLLASSPDQPSRKLKEGETAQGAELVKINKDSAVFLYKNQRTRLALGE